MKTTTVFNTSFELYHFVFVQFFNEVLEFLSSSSRLAALGLIVSSSGSECVYLFVSVLNTIYTTTGPETRSDEDYKNHREVVPSNILILGKSPSSSVCMHLCLKWHQNFIIITSRFLSCSIGQAPTLYIYIYICDCTCVMNSEPVFL